MSQRRVVLEPQSSLNLYTTLRIPMKIAHFTPVITLVVVEDTADLVEAVVAVVAATADIEVIMELGEAPMTTHVTDEVLKIIL